jgi:hypothetical protein
MIDYRPQGHTDARTAIAANISKSCAALKAGTPAGAIPAKVSESERARVTAGLGQPLSPPCPSTSSGGNPQCSERSRRVNGATSGD